jgi:hypothetical protein
MNKVAARLFGLHTVDMSKYNTRWKNGSGDYAPSPSPQPPSSPTLRERKGGDERSRGDSALASVNERYHVLRSPLSRSAGEGPGVRAPRASPPAPPAVPPQGEEVGEGERTNAGHPSRNGRTGLVRA